MDDYESGAVLWVKCGTLHWPSTLVKEKDMDQELKESLAEEKRKPILVVKFFNEDG